MYGPKPKDPVSRAAGYIGLAARYGGDVEAARQNFEAAKLEKHIIEIVPVLSPQQRSGMLTVLLTVIQESVTLASSA